MATQNKPRLNIITPAFSNVKNKCPSTKAKRDETHTNPSTPAALAVMMQTIAHDSDESSAFKRMCYRKKRLKGIIGSDPVLISLIEWKLSIISVLSVISLFATLMNNCLIGAKSDTTQCECFA
ncbi:hypothetical protein LQZ18_10325 [Lachnospiraceae bacterium ZAX-1]